MNSQAQLTRRSRLVGAANHLLPALLKARLLADVELDVAELCARATRDTGLDGFGDPWFAGPLAVLVEALREEAALNRLGRFVATGQISKVLRDRLLAEHWLRGHPEIAARAIRSPVIVVGPMRSGTTRIHRLLAADERFAHLRFFETVCPVPAPGFRHGGKDRRPLVAATALGAVRSFNPHTAVIHPTGPYEPEEELGLLVASFWGMKHEAQWHVPGYGRWCEGQDATPAYRHMANLLRLVGWSRGECDTRPWVLKTPQHMLDLPALLRVFPDARIVFAHRAPEAVVGSSCSLVWNQMVIHSDRVDPRGIGREWLRKTELQIESMRAARRDIPESQRIDLRYEDMERDWRGAMRRIYDFLDMDIAPALPAMSAYLEDSERNWNRHRHSYSLEAFGLAAGEVGERFAPYKQAFGLHSAARAPTEDDAEPVAAQAAARRGVVLPA